MSVPHTVVLADCTPVPWPNGAGITRDLAVGVASAGDGPAFDWRLSLADIERDAPFSVLPGVDRVFTMARGEVLLDFDAPSRTVACRAGGVVLRFPGEAAPRSRVPGGPGRALNLMLARGRCIGAMRHVALPAGAVLDARWPEQLAVAFAATPIARHCLVLAGQAESHDRIARADEAFDFDASSPADLAAPLRARGACTLVETLVLRPRPVPETDR